MEINHHKEEGIMHITISKNPESGGAEINPNITPEPDKDREIIGIEIPEAGKFIRDSIIESAQARLMKMDINSGSSPECVIKRWMNNFALSLSRFFKQPRSLCPSGRITCKVLET